MMAINPEKLIKLARNFDQAALGQIYDRYSDPLFGYAYKHTGDAQLAEDLVAETFRRFLQALKRRRAKGSFAGLSVPHHPQSDHR